MSKLSIVPLVYATSGTMTFPFPTVLLMWKTAKGIAQEMKTETSARSCCARTGCLSTLMLQVGDWLTETYLTENVRAKLQRRIEDLPP